MDQKIRCANPNCQRLFLPNPRVKNQRFCGRAQCRRYSKKQWRRQKMKEDPDYRLNHLDSQKSWLEKNPDYWRRYRSRHPDYVLHNRVLQRERDHKRRVRNLAKMDTLMHKYLVIPDAYPFLAKKDSLDFPACQSYAGNHGGSP